MFKHTAMLHAFFGIITSTLVVQTSLGDTITVTSESGGTGGPECTLRDAMLAANSDTAGGGCPAGNGPDIIELPVGAIITLTEVDNIAAYGPNGLPLVDHSEITINGNGATVQRDDQGGIPNFRIFHSSVGGHLTLNDLTIRNGDSGDEYAGAIDNESGSTMVLNNCTVTENSSGSWNGGGIGNWGIMTLTDCTISYNNAVSAGDGIYNAGMLTIDHSSISNNAGPGISSSGILSMNDCTVMDNSGSGIGGPMVTMVNCVISGNGAYGVYGSGTLTMDSCTVSNNMGPGDGGGIHFSGDSLTLTDCTITGNATDTDFWSGGGIYIGDADSAILTGCTISDNTARSGGGIHNHASVTMTDCTITRNIAGAFGGGINGGGPLILTDCTISNNTANGDYPLGAGGGVSSLGMLTMNNCTVSGNTAPWSGGGVSAFGPTTLSNCTITGNAALQHGGGVYIDADEDAVNLTCSTVSGNMAPQGGGIYSHNAITLEHSIVANSIDGADCADVGGLLIDGGYNIVEDGSCISDPTSFSGDPLLGPLHNNGGPTRTHALLEGSLALDAIPSPECVVDDDQRGVPRPLGGGCDIGSFERGACVTTADCADLDGDGIRDDNCVWWECDAVACIATDVGYGDMGGGNGACAPDGTADSNDRFHVLNCFSNQDTLGNPLAYPCESAPPAAYNVDVASSGAPCVPDGVCDANDAFGALNAFEGTTSCTCGSPAPSAPSAVLDKTIIALESNRAVVRSGELLEVRAVLETAVRDLRGYQLHIGVSGGHTGVVELVDMSIDDRRDAAFAGLNIWEAFNVQTQQMLAGLDCAGVPTPAGTYLATFVFEASRDAAGDFTIELLADRANTLHRTALFPTPAQGVIGVQAAEPLMIHVDARRVAPSRRAH